MKAYVQLVQQKERELGTDVLTHQKVSYQLTQRSRSSRRPVADGSTPCAAQWSGADYADNLLKTVTGGVSSTAAMGAGVT